MFDSEVTKLEKTVASLEAKKADLERKHGEAGQRRGALDGQRQTFLTRIADGDDGARRDLRELENRKQTFAEDTEAFVAAIKDVTAKLSGARKELDGAHHRLQIDDAEKQIAALPVVETALDNSLAGVHQTLDAFLSAVDGIGAALCELDSKRYENTAPALKQQIGRATLARFVAIGANAKDSVDHFAVVKMELRNAISTLRFRLDPDVKPGPGEKLFHVRVAVPGLKGILDLRPGDRIALRDDEATELLKHGTLEPAV